MEVSLCSKELITLYITLQMYKIKEIEFLSNYEFRVSTCICDYRRRANLNTPLKGGLQIQKLPLNSFCSYVYSTTLLNCIGYIASNGKVINGEGFRREPPWPI